MPGTPLRMEVACRGHIFHHKVSGDAGSGLVPKKGSVITDRLHSKELLAGGWEEECVCVIVW